MIALIAVIVIIVLSIAYFYLKSPLLTSIVTTFAAIIGVLVAFNFYEVAADQLLSRGHGGQWAHSGCFLLLFIIQKGWRDGWEGFLIAYLTSTGTLLKYAKLRQLRIQAKKNK